jgi:hypothetical protein
MRVSVREREWSLRVSRSRRRGRLCLAAVQPLIERRVDRAAIAGGIDRVMKLVFHSGT